jgi:DNA polymerase-3 subunit alpha
VLLICRNRAGYGQLCELLTRAYLDNKHRGRAELRREWFENGAAADLLCLSGAMSGDIGAAIAAGNVEQAEQLAADWARLFPGAFYIEIQRAGHPGSERYIRHAVDIAGRLGLPLVATHPMQFLEARGLQGARGAGVHRPGLRARRQAPAARLHEEQYLKSRRDGELFADLPEALENAVEIARRCNADGQLGKSFLPLFPTPEGMTLDDFLRSRPGPASSASRPALPASGRARGAASALRRAPQFETDTIVQMGFPGYFLIVADFIRWGRRTACPSARVEVRAPARWSRTHSASPTSIRCATRCCSSAS